MFNSLRAGQLATALPALIGGALPPEVRAALRAYDAAGQMTMPAAARPGEPVQAAIREAAATAVQTAARTGAITVDPGPVAIARSAEQELRDRADIARAVLDAATAGVCAAADRHAPALTTAIQARHAEVVSELAALAAQLPPGVNDQAALETGDPVRERYLRARDLTGELSRLRDLLGLVHPDARFSAAPGSMERSALYCRTPHLYDNSHRYPEPGSLEFWIMLITEAGAEAVWCPTIGQAEARCRELVEQRRLNDIAALPAGATVW